MNIEERVKKHQEIVMEAGELQVELVRINAFLGREADNRDNAAAIKDGKIMVKFAGTACYLPVGVFNAELQKRKNEIEKRISDLEKEKVKL